MIKRLIDFFLSLMGLLVLWPILLIVCLVVFLADGAPIFFRQERIGRNGRPFKIWKFRTMRVNNGGSQITVEGDNRIFPVGEFLRKYKLDEVPQLINVLLGEMSFVGPRPEVEKYVKLYSDEQRRVLDVRPGITDPASLKYYNESEILGKSKDPEKTYINEIMPDKLRINQEYLRKRTLVSDIQIILKTIF